MASLANLVKTLENKKAQAAATRRKNQRELKKTKKSLRRSSSSLNAIERSIRSTQESLTTVSVALLQYGERESSIKSLIESTGERLAREIAMKTEAWGELKGESNGERRKSITRRVDSISDTILHLQEETRARKRMLKKITGELAQFSGQKSKFLTLIRKKRSEKPGLAKIVGKERKRSDTLSRAIESKYRQESTALKGLRKVRDRIAEITTKRRRLVARKATAKRKSKSKRSTTSRKASTKAKRSTSSRKPKRTTKRAKPKRSTTARKASTKRTKAKRSTVSRKPKRTTAKPKQRAKRVVRRSSSSKRR